jgi:hypothetical protein
LVEQEIDMKKPTLQGTTAQLRAAKAEIAKEKATIIRQKAEIKAWGISQRKAMNELIRTGQVPSDVNSKDNNQNRNANVGKKGNVPFGPKKPTDAEKKVQEVRSKVKKYKAVGGGRAAAAIDSRRGGLAKSLMARKLMPKT